MMELAARIAELEHAQTTGETIPEKDIEGEIKRLSVQKAQVTRKVYRALSAWECVQVARHPDRPRGVDYLESLIEDFVPLAGDRFHKKHTTTPLIFGPAQYAAPRK